MSACVDCPRACRADRENGGVGFCGGGKYAKIAKVADPFCYEEPCFGKSVVALFFGGCSLRCSYCQNFEISRAGAGREYNDGELAALFDGADKPIDLVTPSHYLTAIERALPFTEKKHEFIYNTSGYETIDAVKRASRFASVFLTDFKYADGDVAAMYSAARGYPKYALRALEQMRIIKDEWDNSGEVPVLKRGLIVRHLVLPGHVQNSLRALDIIASAVGTDVVLSLMSQFTPNGVGQPNRRLKKIEYKLVVEHAYKLGFKNGYVQEFSSADKTYTPDFSSSDE